MRKPILSLVLGTALLPTLAGAQATVDLRVNLPVVLPQLVVVQPGVKVVPECDEEVFYSDRYYWVRRENVWYRSHDHRGGWVLVSPRAVPARLVGIPPGHYKHWKAEKREKHWKEERGRPAPVVYRPGPPVYERGDRHDRGGDRDHDREGDRGEGRGNGRGHGRGHDKHGD